MSDSLSNLKNSKVVKVLSQIDSKEYPNLKKFVYSPFFCTDEKIQSLFIFIMKSAPEFSETKLENHKVYQHLFGKEPKKNDLQKIRNLNNRLLKVIYNYLQYQMSQKYGIWQWWFLLRATDGKVSNQELAKLSRDSERFVEEKAPLGSRDLIGKYLLADFKLVQSQNRFQAGGEKLKHSINYLEELFFTEKFKRLCLNMQIDFAGGAQAAISQLHASSDINKFLEYYESYPQKSLLSLIYYHLFKAFIYLKERDILNINNHFKQFQEIKVQLALLNTVDTNPGHSLWDDLVDIYNLGITLCNQISRGLDPNYDEKTFELYEEQLGYGLTYSGDILPHAHYKNIVTLALRLGKYEKASQIIHNYKADLDASIRNDVYNYNISNLNLYLENYREVHKILTQSDFADSYYKIGALIIRIKAYYQCIGTIDHPDASEDFHILRRRTMALLRRNKDLNSHQKVSYRNFLEVIFLLEKVKQGKPLGKIDIMNSIQTKDPLFEEKWLIKNTEELFQF